MVIKQISLNIGEKWISKYNAEIEALLNSLEGVDIEQKANEEDGETADSFQQDMHFNAQENLLTFQRVLNAAEFKADELFQVVLDLMDQNIPYDILIETLLILLPKLDIHLTDQLLLQILKKAIIKKDLRLLDFFIARYIKNDSLFNAYVKCGLLAEALKHDVFDHLVTLPDK